MRYLITLDNKDNYKSYPEVENWLKKNQKKLNKKTDFNFIYFHDETSLSQVIEKLNEIHIKLENNTFYIVLHSSKLENSKKQTIKEFKNAFNTEYVIPQSHIKKEFYYECMPKLTSGNEDVDFEKDIKPFFIDRVLEEKFANIFNKYPDDFTKEIKALNDHLKDKK